MGVIVWQNKKGKLKFQPMLSDGSARFTFYNGYVEETFVYWMQDFPQDDRYKPALYRSKKRAEKVARKYEDSKKDKNTYRPIGEITSD